LSTENSDRIEGPARNLREHIRAERFRGSAALKRVRKEFEDCQSPYSRASRFVVVHSPYPEDAASSEPLDESPRAGHWCGCNCGKSDLLRVFEEELKGNDNCRVVSFLNSRTHLGEHENFYDKVFLEELINQQPDLAGAGRIWLDRLFDTVCSVLNRLSLFVRAATVTFASVLTATITANSLRFLLDVWQKPEYATVVQWLGQHWVAIGLASVGLLFVWMLYAWAKVRFDKDAEEAWTRAWSVRTSDDIRCKIKEDLRKKQPEILRRLTGKHRTLAVVIDDIDELDGDSFGNFASLYEAAQKSKSSLFILAAYNPANPKLRLPEHSHVGQELEPENARQNGWELVELAPPTRAQVLALLWSYFKDERIEEQVRLLEQRCGEVADNPGLVLPFLASLESDSIPADAILQWDERELLARFDQYLAHDHRVAEELIESIKHKPDGENCLEGLKYLLAFHKDRIPEKHFHAVARTLTVQQTDQYMRILGSETVRLIRTVIRDGAGFYEFTRPHLRVLLEAGWRQWRDDAEAYATRVFEGLHRVRNLADEPALAFLAAPSRLAIDVLWREGEYSLNYQGSSDAGTAIQYYGLRRGGALGKWLALCAQQSDGELDWGYFYWKSDARNNPYRKLKQKQYPPDSFAAELVLTAGRLYWMTGEHDTAAKVWDEQWRNVCDRVTQLTGPAGNKLQDADTRIRTALAEMLYWRGREGDWEQARILCQGAVRQSAGPVAAPGARLLLALVEQYRATGVGNQLEDYTFLRSADDLKNLRKAADDLPGDRLEQVRALHAVVEGLWEISEASGAAAPRELELDRLAQETAPPMEGEIETRLEEMMKTLEKFAAWRQGKRFPANDTYRTEEGDLLYWQGLYTLHRASHFRIEAIRLLAPDKQLLGDTRASQAQEVLDCCAGAGKKLGEYCIRTLLEHQTPGALAGPIERLENAAERGRRDPATAPTEGQQARRGLEQLYQAGWSALVSSARERFRLADTIYRRLGCRPGIAAVALEVGRLDRMLDREGPSEKTRPPKWIESYERFFRYSDGAVGYHLDALRARLDLARWGAEQDLPRAIAELRLAEQLAGSKSLALPPILVAELRYWRAGLMGNLAHRGADAEVAELFERASRQFNESSGSATSISDDNLLKRRMNCHWWLAELLSRRSSRAPDANESSGIRKQALTHCNALRKLARNSAHWLNRARLVQGELLPLEGEAVKGFTELEAASAYFESTGDVFNQVQCLVGLTELASQKFAETGWDDCVKRGRNYPGKLVQAANQMASNADGLNFDFKLVLARACRLIGTDLTLSGAADPRAQAKFKLFWLERAFSLYESLGLVGHAVELYRLIEGLYRQTGDAAGLAAFQLRVALLIRHFDPTRDQMPPGFSAVMLECVGIAAPLSGEDGGKREALERAQSMMRSDPPDYAGAIQSLEFARGLIDADNPQETDAQVLAHLRSCCYLEGDADKAGELESELAMIESTRQSRDFLALASHYERMGGDAEWALQMAAGVPVENRYSREARERLRGIRFENAARQASGAA